MNIIYDENTKNEISNGIQKNTFWKSALIFGLFFILILFLWQYNFVPLKINGQINAADTLANNKKCDEAFLSMDETLKSHSFLDSYVRMEYVEFTIICNKYYPENNLIYAKRGLELLKEAVKIQPFYTRYWISMGTYANSLASNEKDTNTKKTLIKEGEYYLDKAAQLSPRHQEIFIERTKLEITGGNYESAKNYSEKCMALNYNQGSCYFYRAVSEIFLKDYSSATKDIKTATEKGSDVYSEENLKQLANAYASIPDYKNLADVFEKLINVNPNFAQYHSSLAFFYKQLGQYDRARTEALKVLQLSPQSKTNVDEFLKTLPY